ncbi:hypothetical protein [Bythopirellula polymerisocia]|nr:hypothetical protein [Bythopirellula polymerisocia]
MPAILAELPAFEQVFRRDLARLIGWEDSRPWPAEACAGSMKHPPDEQYS